MSDVTAITQGLLLNTLLRQNVNLVKGCSFAAAIVPRLNPGSNPAYQFRSPEYSWSPVYGVNDNDAIDSDPAKFILSPDVSTNYDVYVSHDFAANLVRVANAINSFSTRHSRALTGMI